MNGARVIAVCSSPSHSMSKPIATYLTLIKGMGVEGDAHAGTTVMHRSRVAQDPSQPNLRQVHLLHAELLDELRVKGFMLAPGQMGENVSTRGVELLNLPRWTRLRLGPKAIVEITGLRNPCTQLDEIQTGLMEAVLERDPDRGLVRKAGIMGIVIESGKVHPGDVISITLPPEPHEPLKPV